MSKNRFVNLSGQQNDHNSKLTAILDNKTFRKFFNKKTLRKIRTTFAAMLTLCFIWLINSPDCKIADPSNATDNTSEIDSVDDVDETEDIDDFSNAENIDRVKFMYESKWNLDTYKDYYNVFLKKLNQIASNHFRTLNIPRTKIKPKMKHQK